MDSNCRINGTTHELKGPINVMLRPPQSSYQSSTDFFDGLVKAADELHVTWNVLETDDNEAKLFKTIKDHGDNMFRVIFRQPPYIRHTHFGFYSMGDLKTQASIYQEGGHTIFLFDRKQVEQILTTGGLSYFILKSVDKPDVKVEYYRRKRLVPAGIESQSVAVGNLVYLKYPD
eukprot:GHVS01022992.1.p1 GENE.GHVS01022992.1~~GHVS01022992.1.p1  ORF type:complete len:174 (-),score=8.47 GHVS01022992.1:246-767(-)